MNSLPPIALRHWSGWWPGHIIAWHDQAQNASQDVERLVLADVPRVGTWNMRTSSWWAARHGYGVPKYDCPQVDASPAPAAVFMLFPAMSWCYLRCWPLAMTFYLQNVGPLHCHTCARRVPRSRLRMRSLRYYDELMTALLCIGCARRWDTWGDGICDAPGAAWWAIRDQDWEAHDAAWKERFAPFEST